MPGNLIEAPRPTRVTLRLAGLRHVTIHRTLLVGFGLVFALWTVSGYDFMQRLAEVQARTAAVNARFTKAEDLLGTIRAQLLLGSLYLRDVLLDVTPLATDDYRTELHARRDKIEQAICEYLPIIDSNEERALFTQLRGGLDDFWETVFPILEWNPLRRTVEAPTLLRQRVIPKRELIIRISASIQALNRTAFEQRQREALLIHQRMERRVAFTSGLALLVSVAVAVLVLVSTGRLENRIRQQQARDARNARDLQRLSARLVEAQEEERRVIARELHDEVGQALTAIKMEISLAEREATGDERRSGALESVRAITDRALHTVRDLSSLLHPPLLDDLGLATAVEYNLRDFSRRTGIRSQLAQEGLHERLAAQIEIAAYRIIQEALTNIARHAAARGCRVSLRQVSSTLSIAVEDDGKGFEASSVPFEQRGLGLVGIQERVSELGGTFHLDSSPGHGARLVVELPAWLNEAGPTAADGGATEAG